MLTVDDLKELGLSTPVASSGNSASLGADRQPQELPQLEPLSGPARALHAVWSGQRVVCLEAPPGSGKSTAVVDILTHLVVRLGLDVHVVCPTRAQAVSLGERLSAKLSKRQFELAVNATSPEGAAVSRHIRSFSHHPGTAGVTVSTIAAAIMNVPSPQLMVCDEAYQATFADLAAAASRAPQLLLVGDPGQIGPVVTVDTSVWGQMKMAPHLRAMDVFQRRSDAVTFAIDRTYRLGSATTEAIADLYTFAFESRRPDRWLSDVNGVALPEIASLPLGTVDGPDDMNLLLPVVSRAAQLAGAVLHEPEGARRLSPADVAIVASRNSQVGILTGKISQLGLDGVTVGTADKLQGGEWAAVVAVDACAGNDQPNDYLTSLGRLCVMASRHTTHLTWAWADGWRQVLLGSDLSPDGQRVAVAVRNALTGQPVAGASSAA